MKISSMNSPTGPMVGRRRGFAGNRIGIELSMASHIGAH
jgi:hypothetical protein